MDTAKSLQEQKETGKLIAAIKSNFKKDGDHRKTTQYCEERLINLQLHFDNFSALDEKLIPHLDEEHPYLAEKYGEQVKKIYEETKVLLLESKKKATPVVPNAQAQLEKETANAASYHLDDDVEQKIPAATNVNLDNKEQEKRYKIQLVKAKMLKENFNNTLKHEETNKLTKAYCELKLKQLTDSWNQFYKNHEDIMVDADEQEFVTQEYFTMDIFNKIQAEYENIMTHTQMIEAQFSPGASTSNNKSSANIKLPKIEIPTFFGDYKQWTAFHSLFKKTVHCNANLSNEEKCITYSRWYGEQPQGYLTI